MVPGGALMYNTTLIDIKPSRDDVDVYSVPITGMADELGDTRVQSMVAVGAFAAITGLFDPEEIIILIPSLFAGKPDEVLKMNMDAVRKGYDYVTENFSV